MRLATGPAAADATAPAEKVAQEKGYPTPEAGDLYLNCGVLHTVVEANINADKSGLHWK